jgi:anti-sigma regulatory factor (Ser/Thr protein kinase)
MRRMRSFPAIPQSVHAARRFATEALTGNSASDLEAIELMVSELATNCIRHERASFHITILRQGAEIRIEVTDSGAGTPAMRSPGPDEPSGRGLQIVDMLSERWGVEPEEPSGKTVWFELLGTADLAADATLTGALRRQPEAAPVAAGPSIVQLAEESTQGPVGQRRCTAGRLERPVGVRSARRAAQGCRGGRRYCHYDEPGRDHPRGDRVHELVERLR